MNRADAYWLRRLARKLKDAESRLESSSNFLEQEYSELENRLEEVRSRGEVCERHVKADTCWTFPR